MDGQTDTHAARVGEEKREGDSKNGITRRGYNIESAREGMKENWINRDIFGAFNFMKSECQP